MVVFKTQSPESALPKELLRPGLAGKDGGVGEDGGGLLLWLLGLIAKKDSYRPGARRRQSSHPQLILKLVNSHPRPQDRHTDPDTGITRMC